MRRTELESPKQASTSLLCQSCHHQMERSARRADHRKSNMHFHHRKQMPLPLHHTLPYWTNSHAS